MTCILLKRSSISDFFISPLAAIVKIDFLRLRPQPPLRDATAVFVIVLCDLSPGLVREERGSLTCTRARDNPRIGPGRALLAKTGELPSQTKELRKDG